MATQRLRLEPKTTGPWQEPQARTPRAARVPAGSIPFEPAPLRPVPTGDGLSLEPRGAVRQPPLNMAPAASAAPNLTTAPGAAPPQPGPLQRGATALRDRVQGVFNRAPVAAAQPAATAAATGATPPAGGAASPGLRARVGGMARSALGGLARVATPAVAGATAWGQSLETPTEDYYRRFGQEDAPRTALNDVGVRIGGVATDIANSLTGGKLEQFYPGAEPSAPQVTANTPSAAALPDTGAGQGRGSAADPNRTDVDPTDPRFGAARDMTRDLRTVPRSMPSDMRDGVVLRTQGPNGPIYSGRNVGADAQMVDGMGRQTESRGTVSTVPGMSRAEIDAIMSRGPGSVGQRGPRSDNTFVPSAGARPGSLFDTPRARRQQDALRLNARGQDMTAETQQRGQDMQLEGIMAGVRERSLRASKDTAAAAALRAAQARFVKEAGGDNAKAAQLASDAGYADIATNLSGMADKTDSRATTRRSAAEEILKPLAVVTNEDGEQEVSDGELQKLMGQLQGLANTQGVKVDDLLKDETTARNSLRLLQGFNKTRNTGIGQMIGWDSQTPELETLPNLEGATRSSVGFIEGALTPNVSRGDTRLRTRGGDYYVPQDLNSDGTRKVIEDLAAPKRRSPRTN